ncbi:hypothetical protein C8Q73DRAFT_353823 [Cubamyces lactineus]|nr:hypothetical protein C8Q73DRAFT_353823 [Cubamyces lactineus]
MPVYSPFQICRRVSTSTHVTEQVQYTIHDMDLPGNPRPDPAHLPSACCKVAHTSGTAGYPDETTRNVEEIQGLAGDGGSTDVLGFAIMSRLVAPAWSSSHLRCCRSGLYHVIAVVYSVCVFGLSAYCLIPMPITV